MGITQDEIVQNAQTVTKGLEALRLEHQSILGDLKTDDDGAAAQNEKCLLIEKVGQRLYFFWGRCPGLSPVPWDDRTEGVK